MSCHATVQRKLCLCFILNLRHFSLSVSLSAYFSEWHIRLHVHPIHTHSQSQPNKVKQQQQQKHKKQKPKAVKGLCVWARTKLISTNAHYTWISMDQYAIIEYQQRCNAYVREKQRTNQRTEWWNWSAKHQKKSAKRPTRIHTHTHARAEWRNRERETSTWNERGNDGASAQERKREWQHRKERNRKLNINTKCGNIIWEWHTYASSAKICLRVCFTKLN